MLYHISFTASILNNNEKVADNPFFQFMNYFSPTAKEFGCTDVLNPKDVEDVPKKLAEMTNGGVDYCFVSVGVVPAMVCDILIQIIKHHIAQQIFRYVML